jgi:hypothetical protein
VKRSCLFAAFACLFALQSAHAQQSPALQFVTEYLRGFAAMDQARLAEEKAFQSSNVDMVSTCIRSGNQYRAAVLLQLSRLRGINAVPAWQSLSARIVALDAHKLEIYSDIAKECMSLKEHGGANVSSVDVMAAVSRYNAKIEAVDKSLFQTSTDVFMTLVAPGGQASHRLSISEAERQALLRQIKVNFGTALDENEQTYLVNAASVIRDFLRSSTTAGQR